MTYADIANTFGRTPVQIVELHLDFCSLNFGVPPCLADGTALPCYNTRATCKSAATYAASTKIYRFSSARVEGLQAVGDAPIFPTLLSVQTSATVLTPGKGLGIRSSLSVSIQDMPWTDVGIDPYQSVRQAYNSLYNADIGYNSDVLYNAGSVAANPDTVGTFWGKFLARNRFYQNRRIDVLTGFLNDDGTYDAANFKRRTYVLANVSGPDASGKVVITANDPLKYADAEKSKWPEASAAILPSDITDVQTTFTVTSALDSNGQDDFSYWWNAGQRYLRVENEIMQATACSGLNTGTVTLTVLRSRMPLWYDIEYNPAVEHKAEASVQPCWAFTDAKVYDIVYFLLHDIAGIPDSFLDYAGWVDEVDNNFQYLVFSTLLTDPVSVKDLLCELTQLAVMIFWHERDQKVYLRGMRFQQNLGGQLNDSSSLGKETVGVSEAPGDLITQFWLYYDASWPLANPQLLSSFRVVDVRADLSREDAEEYGKPAIKEVRTRWLNRNNSSAAASIGGTMVQQYRDVRKVITFQLDPKDDKFWVGDTVGIATRYIQDAEGSPSPKNFLITQAQEMFNGAKLCIKYTAMELFSYVRTGLITHPDSLIVDPVLAPPDYSLASDADKAKYAFICYDTPTDAPVFPDGTVAYQVQ